MSLNFKNFINTQSFSSKMNDFQDLEHIEQVKNGKTLDELLIEAFALVREASKRTRNE